MKKAYKTFGFLKAVAVLLILSAAAYYGYQFYRTYIMEKEILKQMLTRLQADSRIAEVVVTKVEYNPFIQKHMTTIKFLEYDAAGDPLDPRYFTFSNNIIQFQSLVVRFQDKFILSGDSLRGKSAYLFWKAFVLDGANTEEFVITPVNQVPQGYKIDGPRNAFEEKIWMEFWQYALYSDKAISKGIKNAQIEAPGTKFIPGILYTLKIEHDGGIRIDTFRIPEVLKGEKIL
jgi:hypothetical protein